MNKQERRSYGKNKKKREPIPRHFKSIEEASEFWDTHSLADYWDLTREVKFDVDIQRRVFLTALEPNLAKRLTHAARRRGVSTETLVNVWLSEKLAANEMDEMARDPDIQRENKAIAREFAVAEQDGLKDR